MVLARANVSHMWGGGVGGSWRALCKALWSHLTLHKLLPAQAFTPLLVATEEVKCWVPHCAVWVPSQEMCMFLSLCSFPVQDLSWPQLLARAALWLLPLSLSPGYMFSGTAYSLSSCLDHGNACNFSLPCKWETPKKSFCRAQTLEGHQYPHASKHLDWDLQRNLGKPYRQALE